MGWLILVAGLALWTGAHLFRCVLPEARAAMTARMGEASKGLFALLILLSLALMVIGYRMAPTVLLWVSPGWAVHANNALMLLAFYVYFTTATAPGTAWILPRLRHPQLAGFKIWAAAHLLVNGDLASVLLFGGLLAWAVAELVVAGRAPPLVDRAEAKIRSPWVHLAVTLVAFVGVAAIHGWIGPWPFA